MDLMQKEREYFGFERNTLPIF